MLYSRTIKVLFYMIFLAALAISCININMPGSGGKAAGGSGEATPPAGTNTATNPPTIESFNASPENLLSGRSATISWSVKNADTIMITPDIGKVDASGSKTVKPANETTYTLVASNAAGMIARPVTIKIMTVSSLEIGAQEFQKAGGGTQTSQQGSGKTIVGTLGSDLQLMNKPDLKVTEAKIIVAPNGHSRRIDCTIVNSGTVATTPFYVYLKIDDVVKDGFDWAYNLAPGNTASFTFPNDLTPDPNTFHRFEIIADAKNTNAELDESNNTLILLLPYY